jgi:hypothetical protein
MVWLDEMGVSPVWIAAGVMVAVHCAALFLLSIGRKRDLERRLCLLESGLRTAFEKERSHMEKRFREFGDRQTEGFEELRTTLVGNRLQVHSRRSGLPEEAAVETRLEKKHRVISLAQMGFDSRDIARKLRLSRGETELLLGLSQRFAYSENGHDGEFL